MSHCLSFNEMGILSAQVPVGWCSLLHGCGVDDNDVHEQPHRMETLGVPLLGGEPCVPPPLFTRCSITTAGALVAMASARFV